MRSLAPYIEVPHLVTGLVTWKRQGHTLYGFKVSSWLCAAVLRSTCMSDVCALVAQLPLFAHSAPHHEQSRTVATEPYSIYSSSHIQTNHFLPIQYTNQLQQTILLQWFHIIHLNILKILHWLYQQWLSFYYSRIILASVLCQGKSDS